MTQTKNETKEQMALCPIGRLFARLEKIPERDSTFFEQLRKSRVEFLKGIRSLVDDRIEDIEKKSAAAHKKKATRVQVE
ncbi:MAG: hypothetical protein R6U38_10785 [Desulfatiglandaceae bacterium]